MIPDKIQVLSDEFKYITDVELKCINIKARIDIMKDKVGYEETVIKPVIKQVYQPRSDIGDIRNKLKPKPSIQDEMQKADEELDRALKKALEQA